jgi:photosystem II stability/assembly factor-like uncharacterized protein
VSRGVLTHLYAATGDAIVHLAREDGGLSATRVLDQPGLQCVAADGDRIVAGSRGRGVWLSEDQGESWENAQLPQPDVFSVAISPADGAVYAGCEPSMLFRRLDAGWEELEALRGLPSAPTWSFPPRPWTSHVRWIAPSPHEPSLLLVGIELGGLMRSEDRGETWEDHRPGAQPDVHSLAWHPREPSRAYEAGGGGSAWSFDAGRTWQPADEGRDRHYTWAVTSDQDDPDCWFVSASPGPFNAHRRGRAEAYVYRWRGEGPWQRLDGGLPEPLDAMPYALAATPEGLYAGLSDGRIYASSDGGDSWEQPTLRGDPVQRIDALAWVD